MNTRVKRVLVVLAGIVIPAIPLVAASASFRGFLDHHPVIAAYLALAAPVLTAVYRELVAWRSSSPQPPAAADESGLTLVELLVAIAIVAIILILLFGTNH